MSDISTKAKPHEDTTQKMNEEANKARKEEDQRKRLQGQAEPVKAAQQAHSQTPTTQSDNKIAEGHKEASRTHDAGRQFQKFSQTQPAHAPPPSLESQKVAADSQQMKVADLHRQREPNVKA